MGGGEGCVCEYISISKCAIPSILWRLHIAMDVNVRTISAYAYALAHAYFERHQRAQHVTDVHAGINGAGCFADRRTAPRQAHHDERVLGTAV